MLEAGSIPDGSMFEKMKTMVNDQNFNSFNDEDGAMTRINDKTLNYENSSSLPKEKASLVNKSTDFTLLKNRKFI